MGLAPYGTDTYCELIRRLATSKNGSFRLDLDYFQALGSNQGMQVKEDGTVELARISRIGWSSCLARRASLTARSRSATWILRFAMQHVFEEVFFDLLNALHRQVPARTS